MSLGRIRRAAFYLLAICSLMLCVATAALSWFSWSANYRCIGWAGARGEADAVMGGRKLLVVWGPPIDRFIRWVPDASAPMRFMPRGFGFVFGPFKLHRPRAGLTRNVGAWDVPSELLGSGGSGPGWLFYPWPSRLTIVDHHPSRPGYDRSWPASLERSHWHGLIYKLDLVAYPTQGDMTAVIYARELEIPSLMITAVAGIFAILPLGVLVRLVRKARRREGHCRTCGYDLTANTSGVCPECGMPAVNKDIPA